MLLKRGNEIKPVGHKHCRPPTVVLAFSDGTLKHGYNPDCPDGSFWMCTVCFKVFVARNEQWWEEFEMNRKDLKLARKLRKNYLKVFKKTGGKVL